MRVVTNETTWSTEKKAQMIKQVSRRRKKKPPVATRRNVRLTSNESWTCSCVPTHLPPFSWVLFERARLGGSSGVVYLGCVRNDGWGEGGSYQKVKKKRERERVVG